MNIEKRKKQLFKFWFKQKDATYDELFGGIASQEQEMIKEAVKEFADKVKEKLYELNGYVSAIEKTAIDALLKEYE
jgi:predicted nuclease with TOPRIM domain